MEVNIIIKTDTAEYKLTLNEAEELYEELYRMFGDKKKEYVPYYPNWPSTDPWAFPPTTPYTGDTSGVITNKDIGVPNEK